MRDLTKESVDWEEFHSHMRAVARHFKLYFPFAETTSSEDGEITVSHPNGPTVSFTDQGPANQEWHHFVGSPGGEIITVPYHLEKSTLGLTRP